jgi:myb proto-oncogene protein
MPIGKRDRWTPEEDAKLTEAVNKHGNHWVEVAAMVFGRTDIQCRVRWINTVDPANRNKGKWSPEEDAKLTKAVKKHGTEWVAVAAMVSGRTNIKCRVRWTQTLNNANRYKGKWIPEEDAKLTEAVKKHGNHWVGVAAMVSGRTDIQCRVRWINTVAPTNGKNAGKWTPEENTKLTEAVREHGTEWVAVAVMVPDRTNKQCREHWVQSLDPTKGKKGNRHQKKTKS